VASALEGLSVLAGALATDSSQTRQAVSARARTCYDHMAGTLGVLLSRSLQGTRMAVGRGSIRSHGGWKEGVLQPWVLTWRQLVRYAAGSPTLPDWASGGPHVGGSLGAAILKVALKRNG